LEKKIHTNISFRDLRYVSGSWPNERVIKDGCWKLRMIPGKQKIEDIRTDGIYGDIDQFTFRIL
jgi:hypothetical protein